MKRSDINLKESKMIAGLPDNILLVCWIVQFFDKGLYLLLMGSFLWFVFVIVYDVSIIICKQAIFCHGWHPIS